jgi:hypothetical protein
VVFQREPPFLHSVVKGAQNKKKKTHTVYRLEGGGGDIWARKENYTQVTPPHIRSKVGKNLFRVGVWAGRKPQKIGKESKRRKNARKKKKTMKKSASGTHM